MVKEYTVKREGLVAVHQFCPSRPYLELHLPDDVHSVLYVDYTIFSRDQGWASSDENASYTWGDVTVRRPPGRNDLRSFNLYVNDRGRAEFKEHHVRWDHRSPPVNWLWRAALRPQDVIQFIPRATYPCWVNFVYRAQITIGYEPMSGSPKPQYSPTSTANLYASPLDVASKEIRLLVLQPGKLGDPVTCSLTTYRLGDGKPFEALSYCWDDLTNCAEMTIDASDLGGPTETLQIPRSVVSALQQLRYQEQSRMIWIDLLSINQNDLDERARQVSIMAELYAEASKIHIWLGECDDSVKMALKIIRDIHNFDARVCPGGDACRCVGTPHTIPVTTIEEIISKAGHSSYKAMYEIFIVYRKTFNVNVANAAGGWKNEQISTLMSCLFSNPWFQRVWVIQEALRARTALVHVGAEMITWDELLIVNGWLSSQEFLARQSHISTTTTMPWIWTDLKAQLANTVDANMEASPVEHDSLLGILDVFIDGLELKSTDPRDKLFALLSFGRETSGTDHLPPAIRPSYNKSPSRVFADFTRWWIRENRSLSILSCIHSQPGRAWQHLLDISTPTHSTQPTWSMGSNGQPIGARATLDAQFDFCAAKNTIPDIGLLDNDTETNPETLRLQGFRVSEIKDICYPLLAVNDQQNRDCMKEIVEVLDKIFDPSGTYSFWNAQVKDTKGIVKGPGANVISSYFSPSGKFRDHVNAHWGYFVRPEVPAIRLQSTGSSPAFNTCETNTVPNCIDPFVFTTSSGFVGVCPWTARKGDVITILYGGKVPYLLREVEKVEDKRDGNEIEGKIFELVGECFVMGIMNGEYLAKQLENGRTPEVFVVV